MSMPFWQAASAYKGYRITATLGHLNVNMLMKFVSDSLFVSVYTAADFPKLGLNARKTVFGGLGTKQAQTSLHIRAV